MSIECICQKCGETLFEFDPKYYYEHPEWADTDCQQMQLQHSLTCHKSPFANTERNWKWWRSHSPAWPDETPRQLVRRLIEAGHSTNEIYALVPVPPDRWGIVHDSITNNWYEEISQIVEEVKNESNS